MPQNTPNLVLTCYDLTTDAGVYFSTFRSTLAGYTNSALTKIDTWAGTVNADLTALKQAPAIVRVSAIKADDFLYNATVVGLAQYTTGMYINLSLDVTNLGTVSLNINSLGGRSLLKVDSTGAFVNITQNDLRLNKNNLFTYNGTAWIWINAVSSDQLNVIGTALNLTRISATNTLEDAGVSFAPTVVNNGIPQRTATGQLKSVEAVANDDVVNKLYADTIDSKIGILSALTTIDKTSVVGAINENSSEIGQIANDRGYITAKRITLAEMETTFEQGKYFVASVGFLDVTAHDVTPSSYCKQTLYYLGGDLVKFRTRNAGVWTAWKELATTENYTHTVLDNGNVFPYAVGIKFSKAGGIVCVAGIVKLGVALKDSIICSGLPQNFKPLDVVLLSGNQVATAVHAPIYIYNDGTLRLGADLSVGMDIFIAGSYLMM